MAQQGFISSGLKYKKINKQLKRLKGVSSNNFISNNSLFILKVASGSQLKPNQLESARRVIRRNLNRDATIRSFNSCDLPKTSKSSGVRMGKGKGNIDYWCTFVPAGKLVFGLNNVSYFQSMYSLQKACKKFSGKKNVFNNIYKLPRSQKNIFEK